MEDPNWNRICHVLLKHHLKKYSVDKDESDLPPEYKMLGEGNNGYVYKYETKNTKAIIKYPKAGAEADLTNEIYMLQKIWENNPSDGFPKLIYADGLGRKLPSHHKSFPPVLVMEHIDGESLSQYVLRSFLGDREVVGLMRNIVKMVCFLHEIGVVHHDLHPGNIMVKYTNAFFREKSWLIDFGFSCEQNKCIAYMAQEKQHSPDVVKLAGNVKPLDFDIAAQGDNYCLLWILVFILTKKTPLAFERMDNYLADAKVIAALQFIEKTFGFDAVVFADNDAGRTARKQFCDKIQPQRHTKAAYRD